VIKFAVLIVIFSIAIAVNTVYYHVIAPITRFISQIVGMILAATGEEVITQGTLILSPRFALDIKNGCNGIEATLILLAAILASPVAWPSRLRGLLIGSAIVQIANIARIAILFRVGQSRPELAEMMHMTVFQAVMFLIAILYFAQWSRTFASSATARTP
jgi:exosortase/archaeosortase family protein